jgi:hypothetical protein
MVDVVHGVTVMAPPEDCFYLGPRGADGEQRGGRLPGCGWRLGRRGGDTEAQGQVAGTGGGSGS